MTTTQTETILSDTEVALLNEARTLLNMLASRSMRDADCDGIHALARTSEHLIFETLNWMDSHRIRPLTDDQLLNRQVQS